MESRPKFRFEQLMLATVVMIGELSVPAMPTIAARYIYSLGKDESNWVGPDLSHMIGLDLLRVALLWAGISLQNEWLVSSYFISGLAETAALNFVWTDQSAKQE